MFKVNNRNVRTKCEICSQLTIKTPNGCSSDFITNLNTFVVLGIFSSNFQRHLGINQIKTL